MNAVNPVSYFATEGEDLPAPNFAEKLSWGPLTTFEKMNLPFCRLLCTAFEREINAIKKPSDDEYDEPYFTIGDLQKKLGMREAWAEAFAKAKNEPFWMFIKHDFLRAARKDGDTVDKPNDKWALSHFKMLCVGVILCYGKKDVKAEMFNHIVNEEGSSDISWQDKEMIDASNFCLYISTTLAMDVWEDHQAQKKESNPAPLDKTLINKTSLYANMYVELLGIICP